MTAPPRAAPMALPRLKAPMFMAEARLGASAAAVMTRICSGGTRAKLATPHRKMTTAAGACHGMTTANRTRRAASAPRVMIRVRSTDLSAKRPPSQLPTVRPTP
ncbi:hypothetical protein D9M71_812130 [compost metagenome]